MPTEEQTNISEELLGANSTIWPGQRLTISNRTVTSFSLALSRGGITTGDIYLRIVATDDFAILANVLIGTAASIPETPTWYKATLATPLLINEEVALLCYGTYSGGSSSAIVCGVKSDVKASENATRRTAVPAWDDQATWDAGYKYTYYAVYPVDPITRVTGLVHRYSRGPMGATYTLEILQGGLYTDWDEIAPSASVAPVYTLASTVKSIPGSQLDPTKPLTILPK